MSEEYRARREEVRARREEVRARREEVRARSEEVRGKREEDSALSTPRSILLALPSSLLALPSSLLALASPLLAFFLFALPSSLLALPGEYQELKDGLQFNGKQWIATGYCPTASDRFECDVTVADAQSNATAAVFGTVREGEPERTFAFYVRQDGDDSSVVAYGDTARGGLFPRVKDKEVVSLSVDPGGATWTWPGGSDRLALTPGFARDGVTPLMIGDANGSSLVDDSFPAGMGTVMKLHRFRIWRGGLELVHDYVPCTDQDGQYGVYDEVGRAFLPCGRKIGFAVNGKDIGCWWKDAGWTYSNGLLSLTNATGYVLSGVATNGEVQVKATDAARVVMSNMAVFASKPPALVVAQSNLAVASNQVMKTGNAPEELRYAQAYRGEKCVLVAPGVPVTPGALPRGNYATAEAATNALVGAYVVPTNRVAAVLTTETLLRTYCDMFDIDVTGGGSSWSLEAVLTPEAWTNLHATVANATRQIPVGAIARMSKVSPIAQLPEEVVTTNVTVRGCAPGFFYSLYDGWALTNVVAGANATNLNVLCGADAKVTFPEVKRPSEKTGFFRVGVGVTDNAGKR